MIILIFYIIFFFSFSFFIFFFFFIFIFHFFFFFFQFLKISFRFRIVPSHGGQPAFGEYSQTLETAGDAPLLALLAGCVPAELRESVLVNPGAVTVITPESPFGLAVSIDALTRVDQVVTRATGVLLVVPVTIAKSEAMEGFSRLKQFASPSLASSSPSASAHLPPTKGGIVNLGSTCFAAAVLQALRFTKTVSALAHSPAWLPGGPFQALKAAIVQLFSASSAGPLDPAPLVRALSSLPGFKGFSFDRQQDAHEFFTLLVDAIAEAKGVFAEGIPWKRVFGGKLVSRLRCAACGELSAPVEEPFTALSVATAGKGTVEDCIAEFFAPEAMTGLDPCSMCGGRDFAKQAMLHEPPAYLVVHLKRFDADGLKTSQNLPLRRAIADAAGAPPLSPLGVSVQGAPWSLYATVDHWGPSRHFGHYAARVKDPLTAQWWQCDDASVQRTGANDAYDEARSYLLFLEQGTKP